MVEVKIERCLGRTEADREITSEPWSLSEKRNRATKTTQESDRRSALKKRLTGPTLLERSGYAAGRQRNRLERHGASGCRDGDENYCAVEGYTGRYVWHCHILEHEDNEMMRPYEVVAVQ